MEVTRVDFLEDGLLQLAHGPVLRHIDGLAQQVVNAAIGHASGRPGPNIRSGDLVEGIRRQAGQDEHGPFMDIGSVAEHRGYPYPGRLETGEDGPHYPWLLPGLADAFEET